jgi:4-amino-4-deoxy-L-arabinose transferase-like glycosyltransferase
VDAEREEEKAAKGSAPSHDPPQTDAKDASSGPPDEPREADREDERDEAREDAPESAPLAGEPAPPRVLRPMLIAAAVVAVIAGFLLFRGIGALGIWDPHELTLADLGCRRAAASGRFDVAACGADNGAKGDLRGAVMVQTVALGFRLFGVTESAGRVPLALWILAGAIVATLAVSSLVDARAGLFSGAVFVTMPMVLAQGRLVLGDAATMGAFAVAFGALAVAAFDRDEDGAPSGWSARTPWAVLGAFGVAACIGARGVAVGTAPAAAIGLAWLLRTANTSRTRDDSAPMRAVVAVIVLAAAVALGLWIAPKEIAATAGEQTRNVMSMWTTRGAIGAALVGAATLGLLPGTLDHRVERAIAGAALALGAFGIAEGIGVATMAEEPRFYAAVGAVLAPTRKFPTFDLLVRQIAHGAFPWSCFFPFALGRALARPATTPAAAVDRELDLRVAALAAATLAFGVQTMIAPRFGLAPFAAPIALAIVIGSVLRDIERAPAGSLAIGIGTAVLAALVLNDFNFEDLSKAPVELATAPFLEPYGLYGVAAPEELRLRLKIALFVAAAVFLLPIFFVWVDDDPRPGWTPRAVVEKPLRGVRAAWNHPVHGLLMLLLASFEACALVVGVIVFKRGLRRHVPQLQALNASQRDFAVNLWWLILAAVVAAYVGYVLFIYGRDAFRNLRRQRVATIAVGGLVAAGIWSFSVMPAVANQFSPKGVFETYRKLGAGSPIALLGVNPRTAAYDLAGASPTVLNDPRSAYEWLIDGKADKKFLALRSENLAETNRLFRTNASPRANLPILDGRSAQVLLAANGLFGAKNQNPLDRMVLDGPPTATQDCAREDGPICVPSHALNCDIDGQLACVGWELFDTQGKTVTSVSSGQHVRLRLIYRVTGHVSGGWQVFIHVEQPGTATARKTWDHPPLQGKYPMDAWLAGDVIVDDSEFNLEPNMRSGSPIMILTGFFSGSVRMKLLSGPDAGQESEGARLVLGTIPVK